jgi:hypothetical protein
VRIVKICRANGQDGAEYDSDQNAHEGLLLPNPERGRKMPVPLPLCAILMANRTILGHAALTLRTHQARSNLLITLKLLPKKLCPQTKFAAILKL